MITSHSLLHGRAPVFQSAFRRVRCDIGLRPACLTGSVRLCQLAIIVVTAFTAIASSGQTVRHSPPSEPKVRPHIERHYENDADENGIDDELERRANAATQAQGTNTVEVRLVFTSQVTQQQIDDFEKLGGVIDYIFQNVSYGWTGHIPLNKVKALRATLGGNLILVHSPKAVHPTMLNATQIGRVRPVWAANFAGFTTGFSGSNDTTIGILDSGVDSTHQDLTNRCLYWKDQSSTAYSTNKDIYQHGTHVAGIALGTGSASGTGTGALSFTTIGQFSGTSTGSEYIVPLLLATNSVTWKVGAKWDSSVGTTAETKSSPWGKNSFTQVGGSANFGSASYSDTFSPNATNIYMSAVASAVGLTNYVITNNLSYYSSAGDGFNRLRGVAPGCNYVAEKIFTDTAGNNGNWTYAAIDDLVSKRTTYNIKVMNMSFANTTADSTLRSDVNNAVNNGIVVVASAGNDGPTGAISDPGLARLAICVGAANSQLALTDYSSVGTNNIVSGGDYKPDLIAPGGSQYYGAILSCDSNSGDGTNFTDQVANDYTIEFGTSMSAPFVSGAAALVIQAMEANGNSWDFNSSSDASLVKMLLCATTTESNTNRETSSNNPTLQRAAAGPNSYPAGKDQYEGYGMINVDAAVQAVQQNLASGLSTNYTLGAATTNARAWAGHFADNGHASYIGLTVPSGADFDLYLYSGSSDTNGNPVILSSSTTSSTTGNTESIIYRPTSAGTNYIVVKKISGSGTFSLVVSNFSNDIFTNSYSISGISGSTAGTNKNFTTETSEPVPTGCFASAWYSWTAPYTGLAAFTGSNCVPSLYTGSTVATLTKLSGQSAAATNVVSVSSGTTYYVQICATNSAGTNFVFNWSTLVTQLNLTNSAGITYSNNITTPYPSSNVISSLVGSITKATVTFNNYSDSQGAMEIASLLVSPNTNKIGLMVGSGDMTSFSNLTITFADGGAYPPSSSVLTNGTYEPSAAAAFLTFGSPAPGRPYSTNLSDLIGQSPNGTWLLYIESESTPAHGSIGSWSLNLSIDQPPTLAIDTTTLNYTNSVSSSNITTSASLASSYYLNLSGGSLTVEVISNADTLDTISVANQGSGAGQIGASGGVLSYGGANIGTYSGGNNGSTPLVISFTNSAATMSVIQQLITNIAFISTSSSTSTRTVEFIATDSNGGSATATKNISITVANHAPTVANAIPNQSATYGSSFSYTVPANTFTDSDSGQTLTYSASGSILGTASGITFNSSTRTFSATTVDAGSGGTIAGNQTINVIATDNGTPPLSVTNSFTLTINKASASITPNAASRSYGVTNPTFSGTLTGFLAADSITATYSTTATTNSAPGTYAITPTLVDTHNDAGNYTITTNSVLLTISKAPVTVTANNLNRSYGATNPTFTVSYTGLTNGQSLGTSDITGSPSLTTSATTNSVVGTYTITNLIGTLSSGNYSLTMSNGTLTVTQAVLTVTASNVSRSYGATNPTFGVTYAGFTNGQTLASSGVTGSPTLTTSATTNSSPGTYTITNALGSLAAANYSFVLSNGTLTVTQATVTVSANNVSRGYGATNPTFTVTYSGFTNGQSLATSGVTGAPTLSTSATTNSSAGAYTITNTIGTLSSGNYSFAMANGTLTVTQAVLTITANSQTRVYGAANPTFTVSYSGFTNNQTLASSGVTGSPTLTTSATTSSAVGAYTITNQTGSLSSANYSFNLVNSTLTITQALLSVTADNFSRTYGTTNPTFTGTLSGIVNNDNITASYASSATTNTAPGTYPILATFTDPQNKLPNYSVTTNNGTLTISKAVLLVMANNASRAYGSSNPIFGVTYSGFANNETALSGTISGAPVLSSAATTVPVGIYTITNSLGSLASADYSFTMTNGTLTVTQTLMTVTPDNFSRAYGQTNPVLTGTIAGVVNSDNITATYTSTATSLSSIGTYPITATLNDPNSSLPNYSVTTNHGTLTVTNASGTSNYTATVISSNSLVAVAAAGTTNISFIDTNSGYGVVVTLTMSPFSSNSVDTVFTFLDTFGPGGTALHLGVDYAQGGSDGSWVNGSEGANFSVSLASTSTNITTNSIAFAISAIGVRPSNGSGFAWNSSGGTNIVNFASEQMYTLDATPTPLSNSAYIGFLRGQNSDCIYQLSDLASATYNGLVLEATFHIGATQGSSATLGTATLVNGQLQCLITGTSGANYIVQATTNLTTANWTSIYTNAAPFTFTDTNAASYTQRFYRVLAQ
jgi:hypothetical protein